MTAYDLGWVLAAICAVWLTCHYAKTAADRHVDRMVADALNVIRDEDWLGDVIGLDSTPIYTATAAHVAKHSAAAIDEEWAELNGGVS